MKNKLLLITIIALFFLTSFLESLTKPLHLAISSPFAYLSTQYFTSYPFTSLIIFLRTLALFLSPLYLFSFIPKSFFLKASILIVLVVFSLLYALQSVSTSQNMISLEWAIPISLADLILLPAIIIYLLFGLLAKASQKIIRPHQDHNLTTPGDQV